MKDIGRALKDGHKGLGSRKPSRSPSPSSIKNIDSQHNFDLAFQKQSQNSNPFNQVAVKDEDEALS